jgi:hypothetical protein
MKVEWRCDEPGTASEKALVKGVYEDRTGAASILR